MEQKISKNSDDYFKKLTKEVHKYLLEFLDYPETIGLGCVNMKFRSIVFEFEHIHKFTLKTLNKYLKILDRVDNLWQNSNFRFNESQFSLEKVHGFYKEILKLESNFSQETFQIRFAYFIAKTLFKNNKTYLRVTIDYKPANFEFTSWLINMTARMKNFEIPGKFDELYIFREYKLHFSNEKEERDDLGLYYCWPDMLNNRNISTLNIEQIDLNDEHLVLLQNYIKYNPLLKQLDLIDNKIGESEVSKLFLKSFVKNKSLSILNFCNNLYDENCLSIIDDIRYSEDNSLTNLSFLDNEFTMEDMGVLIKNFRYKGHNLVLVI